MMNNIIRNAFIYLTAIILFAGTGVYAKGSKLSGSQWNLVEANGFVVSKTSAGINFSESGTRFTGSTGCNRIFGELSVKGRRIDFGDVGTTKRMCKLMAGSVPENVFLKALDDAKTFRVNANTLRLADRRGRTILKFKKARNDTDQLQDKKWVLESIKGRQTFAPLPYAFINFDLKKGSAGGNTSCNVFGGNYKANGNSITFSDMISTMRACIEDNRMSVERDFMDGLQRATRFELKGNRVSFYNAKELLLTFRGEKK